MNQAQATARLKQLAQDTARAIAPGVAITVEPGNPLVSGCGPEFADNVVAYTLLLPKLPAERSHQILLAAKAYFEKKGYWIDAFQPTGASPAVHAETPDGFLITYTIATDGTSYVGASSPCVSRG